VLAVTLAVDGVGGLLSFRVTSVSRDAMRTALVAVGSVLNEILLGEFEPLGDASSGFIHRLAFPPMALGAIHDRF